VRSETHLRNVASLPCAACSLEGYSQAAHSNEYRHGKARGLKANDFATFPLCCDRPGVVGCHTKHDQLIGISREEVDRRTDIYIARTLMALCEQGKLKVCK
jgi:hypothetical protein